VHTACLSLAGAATATATRVMKCDIHTLSKT